MSQAAAIAAPAAPPPRIDYADLQAMLKDPWTPASKIAAYLTGDPKFSKPFSPALRPDPALVEMPPQADLATRAAAGMAAFNGIERWRRKMRFEAAGPDDPRPVVLAEGDSWFQFPILLADVVDQFEADFRVRCLSAGGDTLRNMVIDNPGYLDEPRGSKLPNLRTFIFSGTGNDFLGEEDGVSLLAQVVEPFTAGLSAAGHIDTPGFRRRYEFVREALSTLLSATQDIKDGLRVVLHGYDYAFPYGGPGETRGDTIYARRDQWLAGPLRDGRGITDPSLQRAIIGELIDKLNGLLASLCGGNTAGGRFPFAWHADLRRTLRSPGDYADELHPTDAGFARVAAKIAGVV